MHLMGNESTTGMAKEKVRTIRLLMPQWQGGNNSTYQLGARLLAWLAPTNEDAIFEVPVTSPDRSTATMEDGVFARTELLSQTAAARDIIEREAPDRIVTFGGDCSVSLAPFSYLATKYAGDVAVLWIDSHTDLSSSEVYPYAHGYPMRNLLGQGDSEFASFVQHPIPGNRLIYVGVGKAELSDATRKRIETIGACVFDRADLSSDFSEVIEKLQSTGARKLLVHFDLDVLDPRFFRSQLFSHPEDYVPEHVRGIATGKLRLEDAARLLTACKSAMDVVALSNTEHLPWDSENLRKALAGFPLLS